jgi:hypothetical protein
VQKIPVSVYLNDGELKVFGRSVDLASKDLSVGYKDYAFRISDVDLHCLNQVDNKLGLETFDSSCGRNAQLKPLQSITKDYSIMTIEIPSGDTENPYIVRSGIYEASVKDGRISGNLGRTKVSIATDKDVYLNSIVGNCVRGDISMISDPQGVLETCLSDLNIEKNHLLFFNEIDHSRYYAEINSIKLYQNKLTLDLPGIQIKNQNPNSTSMNFLDLKVDCFREKNHNPLSYQEQINFCLKEGEVHLDKVVMPTRKKDVADLYEIYESIMKSPKLEVKNSPIDQIRQVKEKVKDISVYIKDGVIKLSAKVKLLGAWKLIKFEAQVIKHDFETKQIVVKRLSANLPPVILNTGIKMAIPESLIQVDHDQYTIQYY